MEMAIPINEDPYYNRESKTSFESVRNATDNRVIVPHPASMEFLRKITQFSDRELKVIYRTFKEICPFGVLTVEDFAELYAQLFPRTQSAAYAKYVFHAFDLNGDDLVCFEDLAETYFILTRGTPAQKLNWVFDFYDVHGKDQVGRMELLDVAKSLDALMTPAKSEETPPEQIFEHTMRIYQEICRHTGSAQHHLNREQFIRYGLSNATILDNFETLYPTFVVSEYF